MKTLKLNRHVLDKETGESLIPGQIIERSNDRAKDFEKFSEDITAIEEVKPKKRKAKK